jgi:hypothetical protein
MITEFIKRNRKRNSDILFLFLFLFFSSCAFFVSTPDKQYKVSVRWPGVNLSQSGSGSSVCRGRSDFYTDKEEKDSYDKKCRKDFESSLESYGNFRLVSDANADINVVVTNFHIQETITTKDDPDNKDCFCLHDIYASIHVEVYMNGEKIDDFTRSASNSQDITANSKNTGYKIDNTLINANNIMKRASNHGAYAVISKVSKSENKARKREKKMLK